MTVKDFACAIGKSEQFVLNRIKKGEIPATKVENHSTNGSFRYEIDAYLVDEWCKYLEEKINAKKQSSAPVTYKKRSSKSTMTPLREAGKQLRELEKQGIYISYGEAVAKGYIKD